LEGVIDLQVLEVVYRYHRVGQPPRFVYGLGRAIEEVNIVMPLRYKEQRESAKQLFSSESTWKERPLHGDIVTYCKEDIKAIYRLYDVFKGYISVEHATQISEQRVKEFRDLPSPVIHSIDHAKVNFNVKDIRTHFNFASVKSARRGRKYSHYDMDD